MVFKFNVLVFAFLLLFTHKSNAGLPHPHGEAKILVEIIRNGELAEFRGNREFMEQTFSHPQVKDRKIVVFSIIGAYREGKSFFLDYCLRYLYATYESVNSTSIPPSNENWIGEPNEPLSGFSWKHGSKADTKGLMMWSDVFLYDAPNRDKIAIVIIDTQGLFEPESTEEENAKIFSFSTLVSSIQIINIKETIKENQIAHLQTAIELTNLIRVQQEGQQNIAGKAFQDLTFLVRDFDDEDFGFGYEGGQTYFDDFFSTQGNDFTKASVNRNNIRDSFDKISCFLLNHPGLIVNEKIFNGAWGELEQEFIDNLKFLIESLLAPDNIVIKRSILRNQLTSQMLKDFLIALSESYSNYQIPEVKNIFQLAIDSQMSAIVEEQVKKYKESWENEVIDYDRGEFVEWVQNKHLLFKAQAIAEFLGAEKIKDEASEKKFKQDLEDQIEKLFYSFAKKTVETYYVFKTEKEMRAIVKEAVAEFDTIIIEGINFELENFEEFIDEKHQNLSNILLLNFVKSTQNFSDEVRQNKFKITLQDEIAKNFKTWKDWAMKHNQDVRIQGLVKAKLEIYRQRIENESDFNRENFEAHIDQKHLEFKEETMQEFLNETSNFSDHQLVEKFKLKLAEEIETFFDSWKISKLRDYKKFSIVHNQQVQTKLAADVQNFTYIYEDEMNLDLDLDHQNFAFYLDQRHREIKNQVIQQFLDASKGFGSQILKEFNEKLEAAVEQKFKDWKPKKFQEQKQHQQKQEEMIEREMVILINSYAIKYEELMVKNLSLDQKDFESFIDEKHRTVEQTILSEFSSKAPSSDASFVNELKVKIVKTFKDLREKKVQEKEKVLEQKRALLEMKIEREILRKVSEYKTAMESNIDFTQQNFETWLQNKHENIKLEIVQNFLKLPEIAEIQDKNEYKRDLESKIGVAFSGLKLAKMDMYEAKKDKAAKEAEVRLETFVAILFESYESNFLPSINYEIEHFELETNNKHEQIKSKTIQDFEELVNKEGDKILKAKSLLYRVKLRKEIQASYNNWRSSANSDNQKILEKKKIKKILDSKLEVTERVDKMNVTIFNYNYKHSIINDTKFEEDLAQKFDLEKMANIRIFNSSLQTLFDYDLRKKFLVEIDVKIDDLYEDWREEALRLKREYERKELIKEEAIFKKTIDKFANKYTTDISKISDNNWDFHNLFNKHHDIMFETLSKEFKAEKSKMMTFYLSKMVMDERFQNEILKLKNKAYTRIDNVIRDRVRNGVWIDWQGNYTLPRYAVESRGSCAFARMNREIGEYCTFNSYAQYHHWREKRTHTSFQILLHSSYNFGSSGVTIKNPGNGHPLCRETDHYCAGFVVYHWWTGYICCVININGDAVHYTNFQTLVEA